METFADQVYDLDLSLYCDEKTVYLEQTSNDRDGGHRHGKHRYGVSRGEV